MTTTDPVAAEPLTETVRVLVVLDTRRDRVHAVTGDQDEAQRLTRELVAKAGGDNLAATMTVGLVTPDPASRRRIEGALAQLGAALPEEAAQLRQQIEDLKSFADGLMAGADSLRAEVEQLRAANAAGLAACDDTEDSYNELFRGSQRPITNINLDAVRTALAGGKRG